jgi:histidine phosphotransferase ChpT
MVTSSGRTALEWAVPAEMMPKRAAKILLNLVLFANDALVRGGTLSVGAEARSGEQEIVIRASGPKIVMDSAIREALTGQLDPAAVDSRTAAAWMAYMLAVQGGGMLQLAEPDAEHLLIGALIRV